MIVEDGTPEFFEKLKTAKISLAKNLATEELLAEIEKKLDCKARVDKTGEWHLELGKQSYRAYKIYFRFYQESVIELLSAQNI